MRSGVGLLFPGSSRYPKAGELAPIAGAYPDVITPLAEIDTVAREFGQGPISEFLLDPRAKPVAEPDGAYLALLGVSAGLFQVTHAADTLIGHSLGELWALVCAGGFTLADGVRLLCLRSLALAPALGQGGMIAADISGYEAGHLVEAMGYSTLTVACVNGHRQTVFSGAEADLTRLGSVLAALGRSQSRLLSPYSYHNPILADAAHAVSVSAAGIVQRPLRRRVYSPTFGRFLTDRDNLVDVVAFGLTRQVDFAGAVSTLYAGGLRRYVECGVGDVLTRCVREIMPSAQVSHVLDRVSPPAAALQPAPAPFIPAPRVPPVAVPAYVPAGREPAVAVTTPTLAAPTATVASGTDRNAVMATLRTIYADTLGYPEELLEDEADLDSDLGVSSLQQIELLAKVSDRFGLPAFARGVRLVDYRTLSKVADVVAAHGFGS
jgi:[acyl-carrier-protein] S-malonyltransferase